MGKLITDVGNRRHRGKKEGEPTEFAAPIEFWKMDLGAFTGRPNRPLPMLPSQTCHYAATRTMPQRSSRLE